MIALGVGYFVLALFGQQGGPIDSRYAFLQTESLLRTGSIRLDAHFEPHRVRRGNRDHPDGTWTLPHQVQRIEGHVYHGYPVGTSLLSIPGVVLMNALGYRATGRDGQFNSRDEMRMQRAHAAALMACLLVVAGCLARLWVPWRWAIPLAVVFAMGTPVLSTSARAMWSHTWGILLLTGVIGVLMLLEKRRAEGLVFPLGWSVLLGSFLAWCYIVRPTFALAILLVCGYLLWRHRAWAMGTVVTGMVWAGLYAVFSEWQYGRWWPPTYSMYRSFGPDRLLEAAWGHLFSPSRGLVVFCPVVLVMAVWLVLGRRHQPCTPLAWLGGAGFATHFGLMCFWPVWWMGHSYGPRAMADALPWVFLLAVLGLAGMLARRRGRDAGSAPGASMAGPARVSEALLAAAPRQRAADAPHGAARRVWPGRCGWTLALVLAIVSVAVHVHPVFHPAGYRWNRWPTDIDRDTRRLWDWRNPQFLSPWTQPARPSEPSRR